MGAMDLVWFLGQERLKMSRQFFLMTPKHIIINVMHSHLYDRQWNCMDRNEGRSPSEAVHALEAAIVAHCTRCADIIPLFLIAVLILVAARCPEYDELMTVDGRERVAEHSRQRTRARRLKRWHWRPQRAYSILYVMKAVQLRVSGIRLQCILSSRFSSNNALETDRTMDT